MRWFVISANVGFRGFYFRFSRTISAMSFTGNSEAWAKAFLHIGQAVAIWSGCLYIRFWKAALRMSVYWSMSSSVSPRLMPQHKLSSFSCFALTRCVVAFSTSRGSLKMPQPRPSSHGSW